MRNKSCAIFIIYFVIIPSFICCDENIFFHQQYIISDEYYNRDGAENTRDMLDNDLPFVEIIGWSNDSLVAYRYTTTESEAPSWEYHFVIFNTIDDIIIEEDYLRMDHWYEEIRSELTNGYKAKWNMLLKKHGIIGNIENPFENIYQNDFNNFPINDFECWFDYSIEKNDNDFGNLIDWKLIVGNNNVQKLISHATERGYYDIHGRKILGYYKSPYENRIGIFVSNYNGFLYPYWGVVLYGCNMDVGLNQ